MKKLKRVGCCILSALLIASLIGCTSGASDPTESTPAVSELPTEAPTEATEVTEAPTEEPTEEPTEATEVTEPTEAETEPATEPTEAATIQNGGSGSGTGSSNTNTGSSNTSTGSSNTSNPPATEPPATQPPATQPPVTEAPATEPSATEPGHVHSYTTTVVAATCTSVGYDLHTCSCGDDYTDNWTDLAEHSWSGWTVTTTATFSSEGSQSRSCSICGKSETQVIPVEVLDTASLESAACNYAASLGFTVDRGCFDGYYPPLDFPVKSMSEAYQAVYGMVASTKSMLEAGKGTIEGARYNCKVEYSHTDNDGTVYIIITDYYG